MVKAVAPSAASDEYKAMEDYDDESVIAAEVISKEADATYTQLMNAAKFGQTMQGLCLFITLSTYSDW